MPAKTVKREAGVAGAVASFVPYIPADKRLPEITVKAVILGALLSVILGAANTYLGLRVGLTVSASIPAAVVAMGVLRLFRRTNILEQNIVQTAASAGESLAAGVLFTVPALLILGYWSEVGYWETSLIAVTGGLLGVFFTVPLRRALIVEAELTFPEGVATSEVLKSGEAKGGGVWALVLGGIVGLLYKFMQTAMEMWTHTALYARRFRDDGVVAFGMDLSPALLAVGYIVGLQIAALVFLGGVIGWLVGIPLYSAFAGDWPTLEAAIRAGLIAGGQPTSPGNVAGGLWSTRIRYMGVGAMLVGGVWSLWKLRKPLGAAVGKAFGTSGPGAKDVPRTEQELSGRATYLGVLAMVVPLVAFYWYVTGSWWIALVMGAVMVVTGFLFSAVGGYMAGLVGSSNNPISGVTILTVLAAAFTLLFLGVDTSLGPAATIMVAAVIACAGAIASDNMQDLKAGYLLGATPRKQQTMQMIGVTAAAFALAPVLQLLHEAYTIGSIDLPAPQAGLMAAVAGFVFEGGLPATMVGIGAGIAVLLIILDEILAATQAPFRTPVMPVAVGIYLPVGLSSPIFVGGLIAFAASRFFRAKKRSKHQDAGMRAGVLFASGAIAGEALVGIAVAGLIVSGAGEVVAVGSGALTWPGLIMFAYVGLLMWFVVRRGAMVAK